MAILVSVAAQESPVQVVGIKLPEKSGHDPLVHIRNTSSKETARIWVEAIISARDGRITRINSNDPNERSGLESVSYPLKAMGGHTRLCCNLRTWLWPRGPFTPTA